MAQCAIATENMRRIGGKEERNVLREDETHEQVGYVVSGEIDLLMKGAEAVRLRAGGSYYVAPHVRHGIVTHAPMVLLDCFTPMHKDFLT